MNMEVKKMIPKIAIDVITELLPMITLFCIVLFLLRFFYLKNNNKEFILYKELINISFIIYILLLFELVTSTDFHSYTNNFIPFREIFRYSFSSPLFYRNVIGNVILFIPFGYFTSYFTKVNKVSISLFITFITSISIELIQSLIGRSFDIDDVLLNITGGLIGYLLYKLTSKLLKKHSIEIKNSILINAISIIIMFILIYIIFALYGVRL